MNSFKNSLLIFALLILMGKAEIANGQSGGLQSIADKYNPYVSDLNIGYAILVKKGKKTETTRMGKYEFDENTVFNIGSGTKAFTAILILQEAEKGHLSLSDSIGKFLDPIHNVPGYLSIQTLLQHESGLGELVGAEYESTFFAPSDSLYRTSFLDRIPAFDSSKVGKYEYCNTNYILLGHLLEKVTDRSYFDLLRERIFIPCGMKNTSPYLSRTIPNLAPPVKNGKEITQYLDHRFFAYYAFSAGGIASTLNDMALYYSQLFTRQTLLSKASLEKMLTMNEADYGLGITRMNHNGTLYYGHGGNNVGYGYRDYYNPQTGELAMFFVNTEQIPFAKMLKSDLLSYLQGEKPNPPFRPNLVKDFEQYTGQYKLNDPEVSCELKVIEDKMYLMIQGATLILVSPKENTLFDGQFGVEIEVQPGKPEELIFRQRQMETIALKQTAQ